MKRRQQQQRSYLERYLKKKKENNAVDTEEDTEAFKLTHYWKLDSKLNFNIQYNT